MSPEPRNNAEILTYESWTAQRQGDRLLITARHGVEEQLLYDFQLSETAEIIQRREVPSLYYGFGLVASLLVLAPFLWARETLSGPVLWASLAGFFLSAPGYLILGRWLVSPEVIEVRLCDGRRLALPSAFAPLFEGSGGR